MSEHKYHVTFMVAPPQDIMWADSIDVTLPEAVAHVDDHDKVVQEVRIKRNLLGDSKIYVMSCTPIDKRRRFKRHPWQLD